MTTMTFKQILNSGMCNLVLPRTDMLKPTTAKSKYLEILPSDLVVNKPAHGSKDEITYSLPVIPCRWVRGTTNGITFFIVLHPLLKQAGVYLIEGVDGVNIFEDMKGYTFSAKTVAQVPWACRVYEASTQLPTL